MNFDKYQTAFIEAELCDCKLIGIPGGGKTRSIIQKIRYNFEKGIFNSRYEYIILTFTNSTRDDFIEKANSKKFNKENVRTLHSVAGGLLSKKSNHLETVIIAAGEFLSGSSDRLDDIKYLKDVKAIFVDEAQDISRSQYDFLLKLKKRLNSFLILIGDPNQSIFQFQGGSDEYLNSYPGKEFKLKNNYRSTPNIVSFVNHISPIKCDMISKRNTKKNKPITIFCDNYDNIEKHILDEITNSRYKLEDMAIIGPVKMCKQNQYGYTNIGLSLLANFLFKKGIKFIKHYRENKENKDTNKYSTQEGHINLLTIHGSKGLEFKKVFLLNFHYKTQGINPNREKFNEFKYLWYVGCSRAKYEMNIYVDKNKTIFPNVKKMDKNIFQLFGNIKYPNIEFKEDKKIIFHSVTQIIENLTPEQLYQFEKIVQYDTLEQEIHDVDSPILEYDKYSALYGILIEEVCQYFYSEQNKDVKNIFERFLEMNENRIEIPQKCIQKIKDMLKRFSLSSDDGLKLEYFENSKLKLNKGETKYLDYLKKLVVKEPFYLVFDNSKLYVDCNNEIKEICEGDYRKDYLSNIFKLVLFRYQKEHELGYIWNFDFSKHLESLQPYVEEVKNYISHRGNPSSHRGEREGKKIGDLVFWKTTTHPNFPIRGEIDILKDGNEIIDIKFTKQLSIKHVIQLILYYNNLFPDFTEIKKLSVWNFFLGKKYSIIFGKKEFTNYDILKFLCQVTEKKISKTLFLYDLETTGLYTNSCQVTDRYFEEYNLKFSPSSGLVKIKGRIPQEVTDLTGISDKMLRLEGHSFDQFKQEIDDIYKYCYRPQFMAHRGNTFDHIIMKRLDLLKGEDFLDSNTIINLLSIHKTSKLKLVDIYEMVMGYKNNYGCHRSMPDVKMMIDILRKIGYNYP